jgi:hypothetical protein
VQVQTTSHHLINYHKCLSQKRKPSAKDINMLKIDTHTKKMTHKPRRQKTNQKKTEVIPFLLQEPPETWRLEISHRIEKSDSTAITINSQWPTHLHTSRDRHSFAQYLMQMPCPLVMKITVCFSLTCQLKTIRRRHSLHLPLNSKLEKLEKIHFLVTEREKFLGGGGWLFGVKWNGKCK